MTDRGGFPYLQGLDIVGIERSPRFTHVISRARQEKRQTGLRGRQWVKWRKASARNVRAFLREAAAHEAHAGGSAS